MTNVIKRIAKGSGKPKTRGCALHASASRSTAIDAQASTAFATDATKQAAMA
jgi:hypothetical protein